MPFLDRGIPVEYEVVRSIATVSQQERKKIGVLQTDAQLYASFNMQSSMPARTSRSSTSWKSSTTWCKSIRRARSPKKYDVLLAVQPSSLGPPQMKNFIAAVKKGQRTAIFEDPFPLLNPDVPGTAAPKMPPGGNNPFMQQRQPPQPKGDINELWQLLGVDFGGANVVWQNYNPFPKLPGLPHEWVFVDRDSGAAEPFNPENPISRDLQQVLFLFPGAVKGLNSSQLKFTRLVTTSNKTGTVPADQIMQRSFMGPPQMNPDLPMLEKPTGDTYIVAAQIRGKVPVEETPLAVENIPMSDQEANVDQADASAESSPEADANEVADAPKTDAAKSMRPRATTAAERRCSRAKPPGAGDQRGAGQRHRLPVWRVLSTAVAGHRSGRRDRLPVRQRAVRAQRVGRAGRRRPLCRDSHAASAAPLADEAAAGDRGSPRRRPQGAGEIPDRTSKTRGSRPRPISTRRSSRCKIARASTSGRRPWTC